MRITAITTFLLAAGIAVAQLPTTGNNTVQGCLNGSSGNYTFVDNSGKNWKLTGNTQDLNAHVGHTIQVSGAPDSTDVNTLKVDSVKMISESCNNAASNSTAPAQNPSSSASTSAAPAATATQPSAQASTTPSTSSTGMAASNSANSSTPAASTPATSTVDQNASQPASTSTADQSATAANSTSSSEQTAATSTTPSTSDQNAPAADKGAKNGLPQTASELPLLGLLGFSSLLGGLFVRRK